MPQIRNLETRRTQYQTRLYPPTFCPNQDRQAGAKMIR